MSHPEKNHNRITVILNLVYSAFSSIDSNKCNLMDLDTIFCHNGRLAQRLTGFEERAGQRAMADAIASALSGDDTEFDSPTSRVLVIEAETGIGKTLAYLVPAVLLQKKIVISTATLNLQDQIFEKDIPSVERIVGESISAVCVKGRENYLCLYRWFQYRSNPQLSLVDDPAIEKIDTWLKHTISGDRSELGWLGEKSPLWAKISARANQCLGGECPEGSGCFISQLRKRAGSAQLLIVNHHLFFSDLALRKGGYGELLPRYEAVIFDEAHHIENVASTFFGSSFSQYQLFDFLSDIEQQAKLDLPADGFDALRSSISGLRKRGEEFADLFPEKRGRYHLQPFVIEVTEQEWKKRVELLCEGMKRVADSVKELTKYSENWNVYGKRGEELEKKLRQIALGEENGSEDYVYWYERRERAVLISQTPVEVAQLLVENLYGAVETCILTSATLSSGGSFSYLKQRLGLDDDTTCLQFSSPFDYQSRSVIYVPESSFPDPASEGYHQQLGERVLELLYASQGRALVLCTSFRGMDELAEMLRERLDYPVLVQGEQARNSLLSQFREEKHSVLIAVASFWEGVDVVGESLSCVVIDKLPFEVPSDPVLQARIERIKNDGGNPFFSFQVPRAVIALRQGVGRLMRASTDRGVVAIMDTRLYNKGYGKIFLKSLPPAPLTRKIEHIQTFFDDGKTT